jgi:hypothetical protein
VKLSQLTEIAGSRPKGARWHNVDALAKRFHATVTTLANHHYTFNLKTNRYINHVELVEDTLTFVYEPSGEIFEFKMRVGNDSHFAHDVAEMVATMIDGGDHRQKLGNVLPLLSQKNLEDPLTTPEAITAWIIYWNNDSQSINPSNITVHEDLTVSVANVHISIMELSLKKFPFKFRSVKSLTLDRNKFGDDLSFLPEQVTDFLSLSENDITDGKAIYDRVKSCNTLYLQGNPFKKRVLGLAKIKNIAYVNFFDIPGTEYDELDKKLEDIFAHNLKKPNPTFHIQSALLDEGLDDLADY